MVELFSAGIGKGTGIKAQIDATDKEIDRMVYELYGLTEEEMGMVEKG